MSVRTLILMGLLVVGPAYAADKPLTAQQEKMTACNQQATEKQLKGTDRQDFMSHCLKASDNAQQERMKECSKQGAGMKGAERKNFMSECLKGHKPS